MIEYIALFAIKQVIDWQFLKNARSDSTESELYHSRLSIQIDLKIVKLKRNQAMYQILSA